MISVDVLILRIRAVPAAIAAAVTTFKMEPRGKDIIATFNGVVDPFH